ncbi:hypothetical protein LP420_17380 [Massilia sp. B-10]|nr:hypothetical protein LP420_17380 [Massilia sp. B-10]
MRMSLVTRWTALVATLLALGIILALALDHLMPGRPVLVSGICLALVVPIAVITMRAQIRPILSLFRAPRRHGHQLQGRRLFLPACTGPRTTNWPTWSAPTMRSATCCASSAWRWCSANCCSTRWCRTRRWRCCWSATPPSSTPTWRHASCSMTGAASRATTWPTSSPTHRPR